jgi:hypothetical protein
MNQQSQRPKANPNSKTQQRYRELANWRPSVSVFSEMRNVTFGSKSTQDLYVRCFARAQIAMYTVMQTLPVFVQPKEFREFEELLADMLELVRGDLRTEVERLDALRRDNGIADGSGSFTAPKLESAVIYTAEASQFLALLLDYDRLVALANRLYMNAVWKRSQAQECMEAWKTRIERLTREINRLQVRARDAQRRVEAEHAASRNRRREDAGEPALPVAVAVATETLVGTTAQEPTAVAPCVNEDKVEAKAEAEVARIAPRRRAAKAAVPELTAAIAAAG